jgi:hypothetical protein
MWQRFCAFGFLLTLFLAGCGKPDDSTANPASPSTIHHPSSINRPPVLRFHWLGKTRLATEANATNFMAIWNLPESVRLEAQTLDKLATAPWRLWQTNVALSNAPSDRLRPLLDDLIAHESYLEVSGATNEPWQAVLAVRLPPDRHIQWASHLPIILGSLFRTNFSMPSESPSSIFHLPSSTLTLVRSNAWTLLSLSPSPLALHSPSSTLHPLPSSPPPSALLASFHSRLAAHGTPHPPRETNYLVEVEMKVDRAVEILGTPAGVTRGINFMNLLVYGDGSNLRTRGTLEFAEKLNLALDTWSVPTNLIGGPLVSFSALRGVAPWLESQTNWTGKKLGAAPDQIFCWSQRAPWLHFFAARTPDPGPIFLLLKDFILSEVNPALAPNRTGEFNWLTNEARVVWKGVPFCTPTFLQTNDLIVGGFAAPPPVLRPMPPEFLQQLEQDPHLVYYDWELTGLQSSSWTQIAQLLRMSFSRAQLSITNAALPWLNSAGTNLDYSVTTVTRAGDRQLAFARASTVGFNSTELQLLVDWLDSPDFPLGLHTLRAPRDFIRNRVRPPGF